MHNSPLTFSPGELTPNHTMLANKGTYSCGSVYAYKLGLSGLPSFLDRDDGGEADDGFVTSTSRTHKRSRERALCTEKTRVPIMAG